MLIVIIDTDFRKVSVDSSAVESVLASTHMNADAAFLPISFSFVVSEVSYSFFQMLVVP